MEGRIAKNANDFSIHCLDIVIRLREEYLIAQIDRLTFLVIETALDDLAPATDFFKRNRCQFHLVLHSAIIRYEALYHQASRAISKRRRSLIRDKRREEAVLTAYQLSLNLYQNLWWTLPDSNRSPPHCK